MFSNSKLKAFNVGAMNVVGPAAKKDEVMKKKQEEEDAAQAYQEFIDTFQESTAKVSKTWVKGGTVNPGSASHSLEDAGRLYKPTSKFVDKTVQERREKDKQEEERRRSAALKPAIPGKKREQEKKKSNLEIFKEELKALQEEREQRHHYKHQARSSSQSSSASEKIPENDASRKTRFEPPAVSQGGSTAGRALGGGIAPPNDLDYPYDYDADRTTTNLFLGNLNPQITEQQLCEIFGQYGPLASVKIMWPRSEEERSRGRNCGFVAFMNRRDGERALDRLRGKEIVGFEMKLGWGKGVPIPPHPIYVPPALLDLIKPPPPSGLPFNAQPREWLRAVRGLNKGRGLISRSGSSHERRPFDTSRMSQEELERTLRDAVVKVVIPTERTVLCLINRMVEFVVREGPIFEAMVMGQEMGHPTFKFLFDNKSPEHIYYRWKLYSILHGDSSNRWRTEEFYMYEGGSSWRPPPMDVYTMGMPDELIDDEDYGVGPASILEDRENGDRESRSDEEPSAPPGRRMGLSDSQRERLDAMLRELGPERPSVGEAMCWCLEHAEAADDICEAIADSLATLQTPLNKKVSRLFLVSDLLHNSSAKVPNASFYRRFFETRLVDIFKDLNEYYQNIEGRFKAEQFKQKVMLCFRAWEDWAIYPNDFLIKLQNIFLGLVPMDEEEEVISRGGSPGPEDPLDGKPLVDYDGDPLDVDGAPLDGDNEELDGEPLKERARSRSRSPVSNRSEAARDSAASSGGNRGGALFVPSKWETVNPEQVEAEAMTLSKWDFLDAAQKEGAETGGIKEDGEIDEDLDGKPLAGLVSYEDEGSSSTTSPGHTSGGLSSSGLLSEIRRAKLREVEVKVVKYQDELEGARRGKRSNKDIDQQVQRYRERLLKEVESGTRDDAGEKASPARRRSRSRERRETKSSRGSAKEKRGGESSERRVRSLVREKTPEERKKGDEKKKSTKDRRRSRTRSRSRDDKSESRSRRRSRSRSRSPASKSSSRHKTSKRK